MNSWFAFLIQAGISRFEPGSLDRTAIVWPTSTLLIPRISSSSGPGQKLPRASISLSIFVVSIWSSSSFVRLSLDEQCDLAGLRFFHEGGNAGDLGDDRVEIVQCPAKELHRHTARQHPHVSDLLRGVQGIEPVCDVLRLHCLERRLGKLGKVRAEACVRPDLILAKRVQAPEG